MKIYQLRNKNVEELNIELIRLLREQFNLRVKSTNGQLSQTHLIKHNRYNIALIKTLLTEKRA